MTHGPHPHRFDPAHLDRLDHPDRRDREDPERILAALDLAGVTDALDLGCGTGYYALPLARRIRGVVHALDVEPKMLERLAERTPPALRDRVRPAPMTDRAIPLPDGSVDLALLMNVYHELPDRAGMLAELARVLRPGGTVAIVDWKAEETPCGPPLSERVPAERIAAELCAAGFPRIAGFTILPYHTFLTGAR